ncbi:diguanylate cyclase [Massilia sp. CMS3.1]|uniref:sensor domain-containing diguanylate cyclase n=1 Tax=Massilia sp. CMS3.1 TaxID=3373083 RepID=UPI003EE733C2
MESNDSVESLRAEHEALMHFLYLAPVGLVQAGIDGEIVMINPISAQLLMPLSPDGCLTNLFTALESVAPDLRLQCEQYPRNNGMVFEGLHIHLRPDERARTSTPQILSLTLLKLDDARIMAVIQDVTAEMRRERQLRQSDAWLSAILTRITDYALVALDRDGRLCDWNDSIARVTGFDEHVIGSPYSVFYPRDAMTDEHLLDRLREADKDGWSMDEGLRLRADGSQFWCSALIAPLPDREAFGDHPHAPAYCMILRDISDKRAATEKRRQAAFCDHLTALPNRRAFFEAAQLELDRANHTPRALALIVFDADNFKRVNDRYGHPAGDRVLCDLADALRETFRAVDTVARLGGEEFGVLLPSTGIEQALASAERLRLLVSTRLVAADGVEIAYTVSAGVAVFDGDAKGIDVLIARADEALYLAKSQGRNRVAAWTPELSNHENPPQRSRDAG